MDKKEIRDRLDRCFSTFIRKRDSNENGYGRCCTCGNIVHWQDADAGHFIGRKHMAVRYHPENVHLQCRPCNRFEYGKEKEYKQFIIRRYGKDKIDELTQKKHQVTKVDADWYISRVEEVATWLAQLLPEHHHS